MWRHDAAERPVQRSARADPRDGPQEACAIAIPTKPRQQFVADFHTYRHVEPLEAREQPPAFALDLRVEARPPLAHQTQLAHHALRELTLLSGREPAGRSLPQHDPLDTIL